MKKWMGQSLSKDLLSIECVPACVDRAVNATTTVPLLLELMVS